MDEYNQNEPAAGEGEVLYTWRFANAQFNEAANELQVAGQPVAVEPRPLRLLRELLHHTNEVVTKEELFEVVWEGRVTVDNVLANAVTKLRRALGEEAGTRVLNVPRVGYRLVGEVERIAVGDLPEMLPELVAGQPVPGRNSLTLVRPLGNDGRRHVWLARHPKTGIHRVFKFAYDSHSLRALKREYTLARYLSRELGSRPDLAGISDANFSSAPYFTESEAAGLNLIEWAEAEGRLASMPLSERLGLFLTIAQAVAAAHSVGVLHKDIKPANILLRRESGDWQPCITDFGSGHLLERKRLDQLGVTALGMTLNDPSPGAGTLMYQPPETHLGGASNVQADVFALGVLLYQLMVGDLHRPMATGWQREVHDELLVSDITAATEGSRSQRLASVSELVDRLKNLQARREEQQHVEQLRAKAAMLQREQERRRTLGPWILATAIFLVAGLASSLWLFRREQLLAEEARAQASRANAIAEFLSRDVLEAADITSAGPNKMLVVNDLLRRVSMNAERRFAGMPQTEGEVRLRLGRLQYSMGNYREAMAEAKMALPKIESATAGSSNPEALAARYFLALTQVALELPAAETTLLETDEKARAQAAMAQPVVALARARGWATYHMWRQQHPQALEQALIADALTVQHMPEDLNARFSIRRFLAEAHYRNGDTKQAEQTARTLLTQPFDGDAIGEVMRASGQVLMAKVRAASAQPKEIEAHLLQARETLIRRLGANEKGVAAIEEELGILYQDMGRMSDARASFSEAARIYLAQFGEAHHGVHINRLNGSITGLLDGKPLEALAALEAERPWFLSNMGPQDSPLLQMIDFLRARALLDLGRAKPAQAILETLNARSLNEASPTAYWPHSLAAERARVMIALGEREKGRSQLESAVKGMTAGGASQWETSRYVPLLR